MLKVYPNKFTEEFINKFEDDYKDYCLQAIRNADLFVDGKVNVFGIKSDLEKLLENIDPTTDERWPLVHYKEYRFQAGASPADVKFMWEYMKHYFLVDAAKAYLLTNNEKYIAKSKAYIEAWLERTEDFIGVSWIGHVHICQRMFSWFCWLDMTKDSALLDREFYNKVDSYLKKQEALLSEEYEIPRNNHKLVSIVTIILCHLHFERFKSADIWLERLKASVEELLYKDGGFTEQSVSYQRLCVEALLILGIALKNHGHRVPDFILTACERSLIYFAKITTPNLQLPIIGDNSNEILIHRPTDFWESEYLYQLAAFLGIVIKSLTEIDPEAFFYLGSFRKREEPFVNFGSFSFPITGHYVLKEEKDYAFLRAGEFGMYNPEATSGHPHSHCDQLGLILHLNGKEILTDPGTYRYNENSFERRLMKDESFHSTFLVDGSHQGVYTSSFSYKDAIDGEGRIEDGSILAELKIGGIKAQRQVSLLNGRCFISDRYTVLDGKKHQLQLFFCLSPRFTVIDLSAERILLQHIGSMEYLALYHDTFTTAEILPGYVSREYNQAKPNQRLVFKLPLEDKLKVNFRFEYVSEKK